MGFMSIATWKSWYFRARSQANCNTFFVLGTSLVIVVELLDINLNFRTYSSIVRHPFSMFSNESFNRDSLSINSKKHLFLQTLPDLVWCLTPINHSEGVFIHDIAQLGDQQAVIVDPSGIFHVYLLLAINSNDLFYWFSWCEMMVYPKTIYQGQNLCFLLEKKKFERFNLMKTRLALVDCIVSLFSSQVVGICWKLSNNLLSPKYAGVQLQTCNSSKKVKKKYANWIKILR